MVAISLYRGNLHKVPDVPRQWTAPTRTISLKDFKILLRRRNRTLSRQAGNNNSAPTAPNPNPNHPNSNSIHVDNNHEPELVDLKKGEKEGGVEGGKLAEDEENLRKLVEKSVDLVEAAEKNEEKTEVPVNTQPEKSNTEDMSSEVERRKKEVEERLEILNEKKHSLVQVLKQILSAEEQLKRQNSTPGTSGRPPLPLHVDTTTDSGSMTKVNTPKIGSDGNPFGGGVDGGEADDVSNHNMHSRRLPRVSSTSPSSDSQQRKPVSNVVPHSYRTTMGVASSSPSRFGPHSGVSVSGTSYMASSPSPAASGGTSVFRDARLPSPWN